MDAVALAHSNALQLLVSHARTKPNAVAFRSKHLGIYRERTWPDYAAMVGRAARGLRALGVSKGERVAIMGDPCEEWMVADLAAQALGAITYGIYPTASGSEVEFQLRDGGAAVFIAQDQEYVDKILPFADRLPALRWIVVVDTSAMFAYDHPKICGYDAVLGEAGRGGEDVAALNELAAAIDPRDPAFIVYTSGTTGSPKGALVAHGRHLAGAFTLVEHYPLLAHSQRTVVYLPLCHVLGRDVAVTLPLLSGLVPHFGEDGEDLAQTLFEVAPTVLFTVPRYLQKFASQALVAVQNSSRPKRFVYDLAMRVGRRQARAHWAGRVGGVATLAYALARAAAFRPLLNKLGFDALALVISGGAPLPPETMALWQIWGVNVCEIYGQTEEAGAIITGQRERFPRPGDVGTVAAGWELTLAESGEILIRGDHMFEGYWGNPAATREVRADDGWLHTGDVGEWKDGRLRLVDRARDFIVTAGGKTLAPASIENVLRASPYVSEVVVFGHARKYPVALVEIDYDTVADWARAHDIAYTGFTSLAEHPRVRALIGAEVDRANTLLARVEQVKAFRILPKALDPEEEGEPVTPTRKVKREQMYERFRDLIESMYGDAEERLLADGAGDVLGVRAGARHREQRQEFQPRKGRP
jgi:long-chain acyl-CoA synthetase